MSNDLELSSVRIIHKDLELSCVRFRNEAGLLELTTGLTGFFIVILVNGLLRREQDDEWVVMEVDDAADRSVEGAPD